MGATCKHRRPICDRISRYSMSRFQLNMTRMATMTILNSAVIKLRNVYIV